MLSFWSALGDAKEGGGVVGVPEGSFGKHHALDVCGHMRPRVMWTISRERNLLILMELSVHLWS